MANILFVTPFMQVANQATPTGVIALSAWLKHFGHNVELIDLQKYHKNSFYNGDTVWYKNLLTKQIALFKPDIIGLSFFSIHVPVMAEICKTLKGILAKNAVKAVIVAGGIHATVEPLQTLKDLPVDYVCIGEGEIPLLALANGEAPSGIQGIASLENFDPSAASVVSELDNLPYPDFSLCNDDYYFKTTGAFSVRDITDFNTRSIELFLSRGCVYRCNFCAWWTLSSFRSYSVDYITGFIETMYKQYHVTNFRFQDTSIGNSKKLLTELCDRIIRQFEPDKFHFWGSIRADQVDKDLLMLMKQAGFTRLFFGFESGSQSILDSMNKKTTVEENYNAARLCKSLGIQCSGTFIINYPGQTADDLKKTEEMIKKMDILEAVISSYVPLPGCNDYAKLKSEGKIKIENIKDWQEISAMSNVNLSNVWADMSADELRYWYKRLTKMTALKPGEEWTPEAAHPKKQESGIIYQYSAGGADLQYSNPPDLNKGRFIPADEKAHIATEYFLLPGKPDGEQTLTITISSPPPPIHIIQGRITGASCKTKIISHGGKQNSKTTSRSRSLRCAL